MGRALFLAAALTLLLGAAQSSKQGNRAEQANATNEVNPRPSTVRRDRAQAAHEAETLQPVQPSQYNPPCEKGQDNRRSDLCAQWKAADSANSAAQWAKWSFILGIAGTFGLFATLYWTRKAVHVAMEATKDADAALATAARNADAALAQAKTTELALKEARRTADAMTAQVEVSRTAAERQLRAYLSVRNAMAMGIKPERLPTFGIEIKNQGETPAYDVRIRSATLWTTESPERAVVHFTEPSKMGTMSGGDDRTYRSRTAENAWPPGLYEAVMSEQAVLVYSGVITYRDIFRKVRRTTFMGYMEAHDIVDGSAVLSLTKRGNRSS